MDSYNVNEKRKSPAIALLWLLLIPGQLILGVLSVALGAWLDTMLFADRAEDAVGHGAPVFSLIIGFIVIAVTVIVILVAIILTIVGMIRINKRNKQINMNGYA